MTDVLTYDLRHGLLADFGQTEFPCKVFGITLRQVNFSLDEPGTLFGFVWKGTAIFQFGGLSKVVMAGEYFSLPFRETFRADGDAIGFAALRLGYYGLPTVGGPVEPRGRLKYIDGCSDTLLISPPLRGEPCFNLLHFPEDIRQTNHTHPTMRAGLIHAGAGYCHTNGATEELLPGKVFVLYPNAVHAFSTVGTTGMTLTVFHPDSDFGPTHHEHPMLNRTIVGGVSARHLDSIRTKNLT
jgi:quercetin dioxygenase-like cupin family protein